MQVNSLCIGATVKIIGDIAFNFQGVVHPAQIAKFSFQYPSESLKSDHSVITSSGLTGAGVRLPVRRTEVRVALVEVVPLLLGREEVWLCAEGSGGCDEEAREF